MGAKRASQSSSLHRGPGGSRAIGLAAPWTLFLLGALACGPSGNGEAQRQGEAPSRAAPSGAVREPVIRPGIEVLLSDSLHLVAGRHVGLITNQTGVDSRGVSSIDRLHDNPELELAALYSPEHGIRGTERGGEQIESARDEQTGLPIHSLYGETRKPTPAMLEGVEVLLFDIQDVGARYYTYVSTMALGMEAAGEAGIPFVVLDRPNPIGGRAVQGNLLDPAFSSFVGMFPIPMRHGMTPGELARMMVGEFGLQVDLSVVPAAGWRRGMFFPETALPWVPPSPNMPSVESALHYPGTCLFEGSNISVGRGTGEAFQVVGAPWLNPAQLLEALGRYRIPGVAFEAVRFTPANPGDGKFGDQEIPGVRLMALAEDYDPTLSALALLREIRQASGESWVWRARHFDRLAGTDALRAGIEAGAPLEALRRGWEEDLEAFRSQRAPYLIYPQ